MALASCRKLLIGSDDLGVRRLAIREFGAPRVAGTLDLLIWAVTEGRISRRDATVLLPKLDSGPRVIATLERQARRLSELI